MIPLVMGSSGRPLAGVYTPPSGRRKGRGVVICPPLGQEMLRSHRTNRILSSRLAEAGWDVLRFDYYCTGESGGETADLSVAGAVEDALVAIDEVRDLASVRRVSVVGLRFGALIGTLAAARAKCVDRLVLWDPVVDGADYLADYVRSGKVVGSNGAFETQGFIYTKSFQDELAKVSIEDASRLPDEVLLVVSQQADHHSPLRTHLEERSEEFTFEFRENEPAWSEQGDLGVGAIPGDIISTIVEW